MTTSTNFHDASKAKFKEAADVRWITFEDSTGNSVAIFVYSLEQLAVFLRELDNAVASFRRDLL